MKLAIASSLLLVCLSVSFKSQANGKLLGIPGVSQVEGAAVGGSLGTISGLCHRRQVGNLRVLH